jgi:hypothetical protein
LEVALRVKGLMKMMTIHLNLEQLSELKEVLEDEFSVLITTYLEDAQLRQQMITAAISAKDYDAVHDWQHIV